MIRYNLIANCGTNQATGAYNSDYTYVRDYAGAGYTTVYNNVFYHTSDNQAFDTSCFTEEFLERLAENEWHVARLIMDLETDTFDIYMDDMSEALAYNQTMRGTSDKLYGFSLLQVIKTMVIFV